MYNEPGVLDFIIKSLNNGGSSGRFRSPAAETCFRMSRNNTVKTNMSTNGPLMKAVAKAMVEQPGTMSTKNLGLCLQNVAFPSHTRANMMRLENYVLVDAICAVVGSSCDANHKDPRNTCMAVLSNMAITPECKKGLFEYQSGKLLKVLLTVVEYGDEDENNALAVEKALVVCKNLANHPDTKEPMFDFPRCLPALMGVINRWVVKMNAKARRRATSTMCPL